MNRPLMLIAGVTAAVILTKLLIEDVFGVDLGVLASSWVTRPGIAGAITVVALLGIDLILPIPSSLVMILSGAAFGVVWGAALSLLGSIGGAWIGFEVARRFGRRASLRFVDEHELRTLERAVSIYGTPAIVVSRALPILMETMSVVAGLSNMTRASFLLAAVTGTLPVAVAYAYAGARSRETGSMVPAVVMLIAAFAGGWLWYRARARHGAARAPTEELAPPDR